MKKVFDTVFRLRNVVIALLILFSLLYYYVPIDQPIDATFLTVSTFLFSVLAGFFISLQSNRHALARDLISSFDGNLAAIYRFFSHFDVKVQDEVGDIFLEHYEPVIERDAWNHHFSHRNNTDTIIRIHMVLDEHLNGKKLNNLENQILNRIIDSLKLAQNDRKKIVSVIEDRIPGSQWALLLILGGVLLFTVSAMTLVAHPVLVALLKAAFATSIVSVLLILRRFNEFKFTRSVIGRQSAQDVVNAIEADRAEPEEEEVAEAAE